MRDRALPAADIITPNQFELEFLAGGAIETLDDALAAIDRVRAMGPDLVLVTSLQRADREPGTIELLAVSGAGAWLVATPMLPLSVNGTGDVTATLFLAHPLRTGAPAAALSRTAASTFAVLEETDRAGTREIQQVPAPYYTPTPPPH